MSEVPLYRGSSPIRKSPPRGPMCAGGDGGSGGEWCGVQGYLADKKTPPPMTLQ